VNSTFKLERIPAFAGMTVAVCRRRANHSTITFTTANAVARAIEPSNPRHAHWIAALMSLQFSSRVLLFASMLAA
jgi:hypothetical protein